MDLPSSVFGAWDNDDDWVQKSIDMGRSPKSTPVENYSVDQAVSSEDSGEELVNGANLENGEAWMEEELFMYPPVSPTESGEEYENGANLGGAEDLVEDVSAQMEDDTLQDPEGLLHSGSEHVEIYYEGDTNNAEEMIESEEVPVKEEPEAEKDVSTESTAQSNENVTEDSAKNFDDLPAVVQKKILRFALVEDRQILVHSSTTNGQNKSSFYSIEHGVKDHGSLNAYPKLPGFLVALFTTKKSVRDVAIPILYGENKWIFWVGDAPQNHLPTFFSSFQNVQTQQIWPRRTLRHFREIKLVELTTHTDLIEITDPLKRAAEEAESLGLPFRLRKLYIRKLQWTNADLAAQLAPMLIEIFKAKRKVAPGISVQSSGVLNIVELISWDLGADAEQKRKARKRTQNVMSAVQSLLANAGYF